MVVHLVKVQVLLNSRYKSLIFFSNGRDTTVGYDLKHVLRSSHNKLIETLIFLKLSKMATRNIYGIHQFISFCRLRPTYTYVLQNKNCAVT